jgi:hypothetical protein
MYKRTLKDAADVRDFINVNLLKGEDLSCNLPIKLTIVHWDKDGNTLCTEVTSVRKNSKTSRPRLYGANNRPIEVSYCDTKTLREEFNKLQDYMIQAEEDELRKKQLEALTLYLGRDLQFEVTHNGFSSGLIKSLEVPVECLKNSNFDSLTTSQLADLRNLCVRMDYYQKLMDKFAEIPSPTDPKFEELSISDKEEFYSLQAVLEGKDVIMERTMSTAWKRAKEYEVFLPVFEDIWHSKLEEFADRLVADNLQEFILRDNSSACFETLCSLIKRGYQPAEVITIEEDKVWAKPVQAIIMKKVN